MAAVPSKKKQYQIIGVLGLFSLLTALAGSSTNLALPRIAIDLHVASSTATWIVQVALITTTILLVMFGHLGDLLSKNLVFTVGGLLFTFGSLLTGVAFDIVTMLVGRFIQAIGAAMVMANSMGIVTENFSDQNRAEALAAIAMFVSVGSISGPALGGLIMSFTSWRWIFLLNVPLGIIGAVIGYRVLPLPHWHWQDIRTTTAGANWTGQNLFTLGIILFFLSGSIFQNGLSRWPLGLGLLVVGTALTAWAFVQDDRAKKPWLAPSLARNHNFIVSVVLLGLAMLVNAVSNILLPFYLQSFGGMSPLGSGLIMVLQDATMLLITPLVGWLADHWDRTKLTIVGLAVLVVSQLGYITFPATITLWRIIPPIVLNGIGMGLFLTPNNAITMGVVAPELTGVAGSFNSFSRTLGMTMGISLGSALLFLQLPGVSQITPALGAHFMHAFAVVFWIATAISFIALIVVAWRAWRTPKQITN